MKKKYLYLIVFSVAFLIGSSLSAAFKYAYDFDIVSPIYRLSEKSQDILEYAVFASMNLRILILILIAAFTFYACAVGIASCLYIGCGVGAMLISYCTSDMNPFTHIAALIFLLAFGAIYVVLSTEASLLRSSLTSVAPKPEVIAKMRGTRQMIYSFLCISVISIFLITALYFFVIYFPI